jgi:hypothetical protein
LPADAGCRVAGPIGGFRTLAAFARWMLAGPSRHVEDAAATVVRAKGSLPTA